MNAEAYDLAIVSFSKAIELKNDYANAWANRGICYHRQKKIELALADYLKSETISKGISSYNIACAYSLLGKPNEAFQWLTLCQQSEFKQKREMIEGDTDFEKIRSDKRWKTILETDWLTPYEKALRAVDERWNANDLAGSLEQCNKAISINPAKTKAYIVRTLIYINMADFTKAMADCDKVIQMEPKNFEAYANKAQIMYKQKKYADALNWFNQAMAINREYIPYGETAMTHFALDQKQEAIQDLKKFLDFYPNDHFSVYFCGYIHYILQQDAEALIYATRAISLNNEMPDYHLLKANIQLATKDLNNAIDEYSTVLRLNDKSGEAYYKRAIAKAERFAKTGNKQDKIDFCADMEKAEGFNYEGAAQYLRELCN